MQSNDPILRLGSHKKAQRGSATTEFFEAADCADDTDGPYLNQRAGHPRHPRNLRPQTVVKNTRSDGFVVQKSKGFTLIEVVIALTLLGIIATLLASGTRLGLDISARGNAKSEALRTERVESELLRRQLQSALPFRYWIETEGKRFEHIAFEGESQRVRFVSRDGIFDGPDGLPRWVDLRRQDLPTGENQLFIEEHRIIPPDNQPAEIITARAEIVNCREARFDYLDTTGENPEWTSAWTGLERRAPLPSAVRLECRTAAGLTKTLIPLEYAEPARLGLRNQ